MTVLWILGGLCVAVAGIALVQGWRGRNTYHRLASYQPAPPELPDRELGTEALDLDAATRAVRRNAALENSAAPWMRTGVLARARVEHIEPFADDATYARRYHAAFIEKKNRGSNDDDC